MGSTSAKFPNRDFNLRLDTTVSGTTIYWSLWAVRIGSYSQSYSFNGSSSWEVVIGGVRRGRAEGLNFDFRGSAPEFLLGSGNFVASPGTHTAAGYANYSVLGYTETSHAVTVSTVPPAPAPLGVDQPTTTSLRYRFASTGDGGSAIIRWEVQYGTDPTLSSGTTIITSSGTSVVGGLPPGTMHAFRSRGVNENGNGPWSAISTGSTLPATPPGMTVTPSLSGGQATVELTPPGGASGVTKYTVQYRLVPAGVPTSVESATSPIVVSGLLGGFSYEWRASAWFGEYQSPWTDWEAHFQPNPNTNAGDYFDGSTVDTAEVNFSWAGTVNNSISLATGNLPLGWSTSFMVPEQADAILLQRVVGGRSGGFAARVTAIADAAGVRVGMDTASPYWTEVEPFTNHFGSMYIQSSTGLTAYALIVWLDAAGDWLAQSWGPAVNVPANPAVWTRLSTVGQGPLGTEYAVVLTAVTSMVAGETFLLDDAMISLGQLFPWFSGDTPDTRDYEYVWMGTANASPSERYSLVNTYDPLADPDCAPFPTPPVPPVIESDCLLDVDEWRRYVVQVPAGEVRQWTGTIPSLMVRTGGSAERQVRIRAYPNPNGLAPESMDLTTGFSAEMILSYIPPHTIITLDGVAARVWAQAGDSDTDPTTVPQVPADRLLYGSDGGPASWPVLECGYGYVFTLDVPVEAPIGNLSTRLLLTQRM